MLKRCVSLFLAVPVLLAAASDVDPMALIRAEHYKQARSILEGKLRQNPKDGNALWQMARLKPFYGDIEGALQFGRQAVEVNGKSAEAHCALAVVLADKAVKTLAGVPGSADGLRLVADSEKEAQAALALNSKLTDCLDVLADFYTGRAGTPSDPKRTDEYLGKMMTADPVAGNLKVGALALGLGQTVRAEDAFKAALKLSPQNFEANSRLAVFYLDSKRFDLAEKFAREAIRVDPSRESGYTELIQTLVFENKDAELDSTLSQAARNVPQDLNPYYQAGRVLLMVNRGYDKAERYFRKYLSQEPEPGRPFPAAAHWRLGQALEKLGKKSEAIAELEIAVKMRPDLKDAAQDLKRLKG